MSAEMYVRTYWQVRAAVDEALSTDESDGAGEGVAADVWLIVRQRDEARAEVVRLRAAAAKPTEDTEREWRMSRRLEDVSFEVRAAETAEET